MKLTLLSAIITSALSVGVSASIIPEHQKGSDWYKTSLSEFTQITDQNNHINKRATNVVLVVGSGMGVSTLTAARIYDGQSKDATGEENRLSFERFPYTSMLKTYSNDHQISNLSSTVSSMMNGVKSNTNLAGLPSNINVSDCDTKNDKLINLLELATAKEMTTALVTNARITSPGIAAAYAHIPNTSWESEVPATCEGKVNDIATQLVTDAAPINVIFGGGLREFTTRENGGNRSEGSLITDWLGAHSNRSFIDSRDELLGFDKMDNTKQVMGLFSDSHMGYAADQRYVDEPSLKEMSLKALDLISSDDQEFFLYVNSARIAHAHKAGNAERALYEVKELSETIDALIADLEAKGKLDDTLIIVTADQSTPLTISGYAARGRNILTTVDDAPIGVADGQPHSILSYPTGPGAENTFEVSDNRVVRRNPNFTNTNMGELDYIQQALIPLAEVTDAGEDIMLFARGPRAFLAQSNTEQHSVFHVINAAAELGAKPYSQREEKY
ncbi:alkaline phosphatase [Vibrio sp. FNV 38]|nr:alkaline phosphatase [Vibrio sp. FNV 38]